jgi:hypothetical protein
MFHRNRRGYEHFESKLCAALPSFSGMAGTGFAVWSWQNQVERDERCVDAQADR